MFVAISDIVIQLFWYCTVCLFMTGAETSLLGWVNECLRPHASGAILSEQLSLGGQKRLLHPLCWMTQSSGFD